jgi:hypothetical protein
VEAVSRAEGNRTSIAAQGGVEYLYDKPYEEKRQRSVFAGPFTVERLSRIAFLGVDELMN